MAAHHTPVAVSQNGCSPERYEQADATLISAARSWRTLLEHQRKFGSCDDGALAEGYSDAVVSLLARHWDQLIVLATLSNQDHAFRAWVIRHIDASASTGDLEMVARRAAKCARNSKTFELCGSIGRAANSALRS